MSEMLTEMSPTGGRRKFGEVLRAIMRHAGMIRIDHVLGLMRSFWIPEGGDEGGDEAAAGGEGSIWVLLPDSATSDRWEKDDRRFFAEAFDAAGYPAAPPPMTTKSCSSIRFAFPVVSLGYFAKIENLDCSQLRIISGLI